MTYLDTVRGLSADPERLEEAYRIAVQAGEEDPFAEAVEAGYAAEPGNVLLAAWHFRLARAARAAAGRVIAWRWALPLALASGLLMWWLSDEANQIRVDDQEVMPTLLLTALPIAACFATLFLAAAGDRRWRRAATVIASLAFLTGYVLVVHPFMAPRVFERQYLELAPMHLGLLGWAGVGAYALRRRSDAADRFAFVARSLEVFILGGLCLGAGVVFTGVSVGLFQAIDVELPEWAMRLFVAGGAGLIPVLAVAIAYDPRVEPLRQSFEEGLGRTITMVVRLLLPLTLVVGAVYLGFIATHFRAPFDNRDVLVIYNAMLFAVVALLVALAPPPGTETPRAVERWLRWGIVAVAALALVVSMYSLVAILYRTAADRITPNRLVFIGWNVVNGLILVLVLARQYRAGRNWLRPLRESLAAGAVVYAGWALLVVLLLPLGATRGAAGLEGLPADIRDLAEEGPYPVLLKCGASPHIYVLDGGRRHWIKDIPTFRDRGYRWDDVRHVTCDSMDAVPLGDPIPPDAGAPPPVP